MINPIENIHVKYSIHDKIQFELDRIIIRFTTNKTKELEWNIFTVRSETITIIKRALRK